MKNPTTHAKDLFLGMLGHELRTPLTNVVLQAQRLRWGRVPDAAKLVQIGESIERSANLQLELIDDLLDVSRIVAGELELERHAVNLCAVVRASLEEVRAAAQRKSIRLEVVLDESVGSIAGDRARLQQVVSNLLTHAIKVTPELGQVSITVSTARDSARIEVRDTGPGMEAAFLPYVFNRFPGDESPTTHRHRGLGLGLEIVRLLVERHQGTVGAESSGPGEGATFSVTLPLMKVARKDDGPISSGEGPSGISSNR